jgi:hypothetical protein
MNEETGGYTMMALLGIQTAVGSECLMCHEMGVRR